MNQLSEPELSFADYWRVFKRRSALFFGIIGAVLLIGVAIAFRLPPMYESTGILLAEEPSVPQTVVPSTVPNDPAERVRVIAQRVLTRNNLKQIIAADHLYPKLSASPGDAVRELRQHISLSAEDPEIVDDLLGSSNHTTDSSSIAFSLSFKYPNAVLARNVAQDLASLYLRESQQARQQQAAQTKQFLTEEAHRLSKAMSKKESQLAAFKSHHADSLPDLTTLNMQSIDRTERELTEAQQQVDTLQARQAQYGDELAQLSPQAPLVDDNGKPVLGARDRLKVLQRQYIQLSSIYSQDYPDVVQVKREMDALSKSSGLPAFDRATLQAELSAREADLAEARKNYSENYPDVQHLEKTVKNLKAAIAAAPRSTGGQADEPAPDNPAYIQTQGQLRATTAAIKAAIKQRDELQAHLADLQKSVHQAPEVERAYQSLNRGYQQLQAQYDDVESKLRQAQTALDLESQSTGERVTLLAAPQVANSPAEPNRLAVLLLTIALAFVFAFGGVAIAESSDSTIRNARDVGACLELPPLAVIPYVYNRQDYQRRNRSRFVAVATVGLWAALITFFVMTPVS